MQSNSIEDEFTNELFIAWITAIAKELEEEERMYKATYTNEQNCRVKPTYIGEVIEE